MMAALFVTIHIQLPTTYIPETGEDLSPIPKVAL